MTYHVSNVRWTLWGCYFQPKSALLVCFNAMLWSLSVFSAMLVLFGVVLVFLSAMLVFLLCHAIAL